MQTPCSLRTRRCIWTTGFTTATARRSRRAGSRSGNIKVGGGQAAAEQGGVKVFLLGGRRNSSHPLTRHLIAHRIGDQNHAFFLDIATSPQKYFLVNMCRIWLIPSSFLSKILNRFRKFRNKGSGPHSRLKKIELRIPLIFFKYQAGVQNWLRFWISGPDNACISIERSICCLL